MDVREEIDDALENLKTWSLPRESRLSLLLRLDDLFRAGRFEIGFAEGSVQELIDMLTYETDREVRGRMFEVTERALSVNYPLEPALDELIANLNDDDPALISYALVLLPLCGERKHLPLVDRYRSHSNDFIRRNAEHAWKYMNGDARADGP